jgi:tetratricopeptide (TPR) repeat protein
MTGFQVIDNKAFDYYRKSWFADAAILFREASNLPGITDRQRFTAKRWMGACYYITGQYAEALEQFGEILKVCQNDEQYHDLVCLTLEYQIHTFVAIADIRDSHAKYLQVLSEIDNSLLWLKDVHKERYRHSILSDKARVLGKMGNIFQAFDFAEKAYAEKKIYGGGFYIGSYIKLVAKYARLLGYQERAREVLKEFREEQDDPHTRVQVMTEWICVLLGMAPPHISEALTVATKIQDLTKSIQSPLNKLVAHGEIGQVYIRAGLYADAFTCFHIVRDIAIMDNQNHQRLLLMRAKEYLECASSLLTQDIDNRANNLTNSLSEFSKEIEVVLNGLMDANNMKSSTRVPAQM